MLPTHWSQGWGCICGTSLLSGLFPEPILQLRHRNCGPDFFLPRCFCSLIATSHLPLCRAKQGRQSNGRISPHSPRAEQQQLPAAENAICAVLDLGFTPFVYPWLYQCCTLGKPPEFYLQAGGCNKSHPSEKSCHGDISTVRQLHGELVQLCLGFSETFHWVSASLLRQVLLNILQCPCGGCFSICLASDQD